MKLWAIVPELILVGLCLTLVPLAGFLHDSRRRMLAPVVAGTGFLACALMSLWMLSWQPLTVFEGTYAVDGLAAVAKFLIELGALTTLLLLVSYFRGLPHLAQVTPMLAFATLGAVGLSSSLDLGLIVLFLQMIGMASYVLIALVRSDPDAREAALKFFIFAAVALAIMAYGLTFLYGLTGSLSLPEIAARLDPGNGFWIGIILVMALVGFGFEITLVPFHFWAPDVFEGATAPIGGFISVIPKVAAFSVLIRFLTQGLPEGSPDWSPLIAGISVATMFTGNLLALRQTRLKRLLAYSTIAQAGYMLLAVAVATKAEHPLPSLEYYLFAYLFMNLGAFAVVAHLERVLGSDRIEAVRGLGKRAPGPAAVLAFALLSLAGIPPLAGFMGKILLLESAIAGGMTWLAVVAAINMVVALYYYVRVIAEIYLRAPLYDYPLPLSFGYVMVYLLTMVGTLLLGIFPAPFWQLALMAERLAPW